MHNDLIKNEFNGGHGCLWKNNKLILSDTILTYILPVQLNNLL